MELDPALVDLIGRREVLNALCTILSADDNFVTGPVTRDAHFALYRLGSSPEEVEHRPGLCTMRAGWGHTTSQEAASVVSYSS